MVLCSLLIGASLLVESLHAVAITMFVIGLVLMSTGAVMALRELRISLRQVEQEHQRLEKLTIAPANR